MIWSLKFRDSYLSVCVSLSFSYGNEPLAKTMLLSPATVRIATLNNLSRFASNKSVSQIAAMSTISNAIIKDHRELKDYYNQVINNTGNHDHQQRFGNQFTWELARHSVGEELVVYPAMEKHLGQKGKDMAEHDRKEHHEVSSA